MITDDDKKEFLRCVLGMREFTRTTPLFSGDKSVTFTSLTLELSRLLDQFLTELPNMCVQAHESKAMQDHRENQLTVYFYTHAPSIKVQAATLRSVMADAIAQYEQPYYTSSVWYSILAAQASFVEDLNELRGNATTESFWKAVSNA